MSANNQITIRKKENGKYQVRHHFVDSLAHSLAGVEPTDEDLLLSILGEDIENLEEAVKIANAYMKEEEVEYGISIEN